MFGLRLIKCASFLTAYVQSLYKKKDFETVSLHAYLTSHDHACHFKAHFKERTTLLVQSYEVMRFDSVSRDQAVSIKAKSKNAFGITVKTAVSKLPSLLKRNQRTSSVLLRRQRRVLLVSHLSSADLLLDFRNLDW